MKEWQSETKLITSDIKVDSTLSKDQDSLNLHSENMNADTQGLYGKGLDVMNQLEQYQDNLKLINELDSNMTNMTNMNYVD
eukprot:CAMPEP_0116899856 /NCGR_PEP_ID=MMETSP0467-20121206/8334_1 /TAXON_ID=283647 /ORGANISM="Mesodinium pulex, Strain SPMC105" /LENGTH=80 /DNA_ID=CAMNT_0004572913 /DNA_START=366 /DNA_END=608 /DNA_ORIENTATION=-